MQALDDPTENALAQVEWARRWDRQLDLPSVDDRRLLDASEARFRHLEAAGRPSEALDAGLEWLDFEPFSVEPATFGSYVASVELADFEMAARIARRGLVPNPNDPLLINNLAFALANSGEIEEAARLFARIPESEVERSAPLVATLGLLSFRSGEINRGRELYAQSARTARSMPGETQALISAFWLREEILAGSSGEAEQAWARFERHAARTSSDAVAAWSERIRRMSLQTDR